MPGTAAGKRPGGCLQRVKSLANDYTLKIPIYKEKCEDKSSGGAVHNSIAMSPRTTPTEITTANTTEISNRNSAGAESDSSIDLAIKEFVGAVGKAGRQYVMLSGMRSFRLSIELFRYAALLREYMRIETIIKHLLFLLNLSCFLKGPHIKWVIFPSRVYCHFRCG